MAQKNNPFHKWLGFDAAVTNPHHFQLLRVSPKLTDQAEIEAAVTAGAKRNRDLLAQVPPGKWDAVVAKLKARVSTAEQTLLDPKLRAQYKSQLRAQIVAAKSSLSGIQGSNKTDLAPTNPNPAASANVVQTPTGAPLSQSGQNVGQPGAGQSANVPPAIGAAVPPAAVQPPVPPVAAVPPVAPAAAIALPASQVPMQAVPLAVPLNQQANAVPAAASNAVPDYVAHGQGAEIQASSPALQDQSFKDGGVPGFPVVINKVRRKKSRLGAVMALGMLAAGLGGAYLIFQNFDELVKLGRGQAVEVESENDNEVQSVLEAANNEPLPQVDIKTMSELNVDEVMEHPDAAKTTFRNPEQEKKMAERIAKQNPDSKEDHDGPMKVNEEPWEESGSKNGNDLESNLDTTTKGVSVENMEPETKAPVKTKVALLMGQFELNSIRRNMERGYRSVYRRESGSAKRCFDMAKSVVSDAKVAQSDEFIPEQQEMVDRVDDSAKLLEHIEGFWNQVRKSADSIHGAQGIIVGSQEVGFVESKPNSVLVKRAGGLIEYGYGFCPPGLAVALAEQGAIKDIPTWSLQKAAFYSIDQLGGLDHKRRIEEFLAIAEDAGHDCDWIRRLDQLESSSVGRPPKESKIGAWGDPDPAIDAFRKEHGYPGARQVDRKKAYRLAELLFDVDSPNFQQRVWMLNEAQQLAIRAGAASLAEDAISEMDLIAKIPRAEYACDSFAKIAKEKLELAQARQLMERAIGFLNSELAESAKSKARLGLKLRLLKLADRFQMADASRRLEQIEL